MLWSLLEGIVGFLLVMGVWFVVQALARKQAGCEADRDMLEGHRCGGCDHAASCRKREQRKEHHEPA